LARLGNAPDGSGGAAAREAGVYLLTGRPGTGKTSLIKQAVAGLGSRAGGFYTEEVREAGARLGFRLVTLDGREMVLAHVDFSKRLRVGKYGVDVPALDRVGVPALLRAARNNDLVVVDEIGRMELLSGEFRQAVLEIINGGGKVLGTVMLQRDPFADAVKRHPRVKVVTLTRDNRSETLKELLGWLGGK
jgi:nucleoside-triphosphatase